MEKEIDRLLADEETIAPSAGFAAGVMAAIERDAAAMKPIAFPWLRALPGFVAVVVALVAAIGSGIGSLQEPGADAYLGESIREITEFSMSIGLVWLVVAIAVTALTAMLPSFLVRYGASAGAIRRA